MLLLCSLLLAAALAAPIADPPVAQLIRTVVTKVHQETRHGNASLYPASTTRNAQDYFQWKYEAGWTSGFFPGMLWMAANLTGDQDLAAAAHAYTAGRAVEADDTSTHDVGFMIFCSFGQGVLLADRAAEYTSVILRAAGSLAKRYNPMVGMTRSWGSINDDKSFEVIIDNLINLELLLWAAQHGGDPAWQTMALSHADKTMEWWIRPDNSTFHLVVFNPNTGAVISRSGTPQGYAVNSTWARGQAWGIYGFTMLFRYTQQQRYLDAAARLYASWVAHVANWVPLWDYNAPPTQPYRDTSSSAIVASALIELHQYRPSDGYLDAAKSIVTVLGARYQGGSHSDAVLVANAHDCGDNGCTVIETDYYFLEALMRLNRL